MRAQSFERFGARRENAGVRFRLLVKLNEITEVTGFGRIVGVRLAAPSERFPREGFFIQTFVREKETAHVHGVYSLRFAREIEREGERVVIIARRPYNAENRILDVDVGIGVGVAVYKRL